MASEQRKQAHSDRVRKLRIEISPISWICAALTVAGTWLLLQLGPVALVLTAALMIVGAVTPGVEWLQARGASRPAAIACTFIAMLLTMVAAATLTLPAMQAQVVDLVHREPQLRETLAVWLESYPITASWATALRAIQYQELVGASASHIFAYSKRALEVVAYLAGAFFLALYMMMDRDRLRGALFGAVPRRHHLRLARVLLKLQTIVGGYIRGQLITCLLASVFLFILLIACGVPNAVAIAVFGGIADVLPFVGAILMIVPSALAAMSKGPLIVGIIVGAILAYQEFESRVLVPLVYGRALRLPSSVVLGRCWHCRWRQRFSCWWKNSMWRCQEKRACRKKWRRGRRSRGIKRNTRNGPKACPLIVRQKSPCAFPNALMMPRNRWCSPDAPRPIARH